MKKIVAAVTLLILASCGSSRKVATTQPQVIKEKNGEIKVIPNKETTQQVEKVITETKNTAKTRLSNTTLAYIETYAPLAMEEMQTSKIPASITLAQGILESGSGTSGLASRSNNHFGIKCHTGWKGERVYHDDDKKGECFRKYKYVATSYRDHSEFLSGRSRYANLFKLKIDDYKRWAKGLRKAGYATDKKYPDKLISYIEKYNLDQYDEIVLKGKVDFKKSKVQKREPNKDLTYEKKDYKIKVSNNIPKKGTHTVTNDDTLYSISRKYGMTVEQIKILNNLKNNNIHEGDVLKLKNNVQRRGYYVVKKKDTLYSIAKKNNITIEQLKKLNSLWSNNLSIGQELKVE